MESGRVAGSQGGAWGNECVVVVIQGRDECGSTIAGQGGTRLLSVGTLTTQELSGGRKSMTRPPPCSYSLLPCSDSPYFSAFSWLLSLWSHLPGHLPYGHHVSPA